MVVRLLPLICEEGQEDVDAMSEHNYQNEAEFYILVVICRALHHVHHQVEHRARGVAGQGKKPRRIAHHQVDVPECH